MAVYMLLDNSKFRKFALLTYDSKKDCIMMTYENRRDPLCNLLHKR